MAIARVGFRAVAAPPVENPASFSFVASVTGTGSTITMPAAAAVGDLVFFTDWAYAAAEAPSLVLPSGWTHAINSQTSGNYRGSMYFKRVLAADLNAAFSGMSGDNLYRSLLVFRPDIDVPVYNIYYNHETIVVGNPSPQSAANGASPGVPMVAVGMQGVGISDTYTGYSSTPAATGVLNIGSGPISRVVYYLPFDFGASCSLDMGDAGAMNMQAISVVRPNS